MRLLMVCLIAGVILSGCAAKVISSNSRTVVVESQGMDSAESQLLADKECAKHQRYARVTARPTYWLREYVFDCVQ
ncbi:hypothetical protein SAMN05216387_107110 [Nitrosovibrio tenuis]|uniref:Lipoprotein n=1 Tax=Nitrosovibrio tenuis TaxID=1233 RepID=A0A1H7NR56_9PROT|nr:hypothetical protein SAMN05216387_107110 [Nitrosovibrio tenuis]